MNWYRISQSTQYYYTIFYGTPAEHNSFINVLSNKKDIRLEYFNESDFDYPLPSGVEKGSICYRISGEGINKDKDLDLSGRLIEGKMTWFPICPYNKEDPGYWETLYPTITMNEFEKEIE